MTYKTITYNRKSYRICGITCDSRLVTAGMAFLAVRGTVVDGTTFINEAVQNGATVIITHADMGDKLSHIAHAVRILYSDSPRQVYAKLCHAFYQPQPACIMAVTGTNGKTSVTHFALQLWQRTQKAAISLGTMGMHGVVEDTTACLTTPEPAVLHRILHRVHCRHNVQYACIEASSHGLDMRRLDGVSLRAAAFTNLSHDHLDYHGDMETYFQAKLHLFSHVLRPHGTAVLNASDGYFCRLQQLCLSRSIRVVSYGVVGKDMAVVPDIHVYALSTTDTGVYVHMSVMQQAFCTHIPLIGKFQLENILCALGLVLQSGLTASQVLPYLSHLTPVCGRMQNVAQTPSGARVFVDYAHTPDALQTALQALRLHTQNRLIAVFGCGGNRDIQKRAVMGKIASQYADKVYITDDNPRCEPPAIIREHILQGGGSNCTDAGNRTDAIHTAIQDTQQGDIVLVAGKGHETGQIIGDTTHPYSDIDTVRNLIQDMHT